MRSYELRRSEAFYYYREVTGSIPGDDIGFFFNLENPSNWTVTLGST
jgi:hypothetical protein